MSSAAPRKAHVFSELPQPIELFFAFAHNQMIAVRQPDPSDKKRCPKCFNTTDIRDGGPSVNGVRAYDLMTDTWGVLRCPACGFRAGAAEFRRPQGK